MVPNANVFGTLRLAYVHDVPNGSQGHLNPAKFHPIANLGGKRRRAFHVPQPTENRHFESLALIVLKYRSVKGVGR